MQEREPALQTAWSALRTQLLFAQILMGIHRYHGNPEEADCAVIIPFGYRRSKEKDTLPGRCNTALAQMAFKLYGIKNIPILSTPETLDAFEAAGESRSPLYELSNLSFTDFPADHLHYLALQVADTVESRSLGRNVALITHPYRVQRSDLLLSGVLPRGSKTIVPKGLPIVWDKQSAVLHGRNPTDAKMYELGAVAIDFIDGVLRFGHNPHIDVSDRFATN